MGIDAFQSGQLVLNTRQLANLTESFKNKPEVTCLANSTIVMGAAAIEALLSEAAYIKNPALYAQKGFRDTGVPDKIIRLMDQTLREASPDASELWEHRKALTHAEPDAERTRILGKRINPEGASWAAEAVEQLARKIWGDQMPKWFSDTTGLQPLF
jgi:hypothetical protein